MSIVPLDDPSSSDSGAAGSNSGGGAAGASAAAAVTSQAAVAAAVAGASTGMLAVVRGARDCAVNPPARPILPGEVVELTVIPGNTGDVFYSTLSAEAAQFGPNRSQLKNTNTNSRRVVCRNLADINVYAANVGDGVTIEVRAR